ncbi:MAG: HNH endonuclease domain-containing protein [Maribacter stanieri]
MISNHFFKIFSNTQNSYKYYWWLSIIEICYKNNIKEICFNEIALKTISKLWYPVNYFKLSFGKIDQCSKHIKQIQKKYHLEDNISEDDLYQFLIEHKNSDSLTKITNELTRYVPYRLIRPWFNEETRALKDSLVNSKILELQNETGPYIIDYESKKIMVTKDWFQWINTNYTLIKTYTLFELIKYLEKENPNVANLSKKLEKPNIRNLSTPTKYWKKFIAKEPYQTDIFQSIQLIHLEKISIDHFLPWSFMTHDLIWNLHPINKNINSSKSNNLPHKSYFEDFYTLQYKFCNFLLHQQSNKPLEDYYSLFNCSNEELKSLSREQFTIRLDSLYAPQYEIAKNMGFECNWKLQ